MATSTSSNSHAASSMAELMARQKATVSTFKKGDRVEGTVTKLSKAEIAVDLDSKSEAIVLEKDKRLLHTLLSLLKVGDKVTVGILNPESESGQPVVSLRRFIDEYAWGKLEEMKTKQEMLDVTVTDVTKGGYVVTAEFGVSGFLPMSHTSFSQNKQVTAGMSLAVQVLEINKKDNKVIFSQKASLTDKEFSDLAKQMPLGTKVMVIIVNVTEHGLHVSIPVTFAERPDLPSLDGYIHISEVSWDKVENLPSLYTVGNEIEAAISKYNKQTHRIDLSIKKLSKDPFDDIAKAYPVDRRVTGTVEAIDETGVHVALTDEVLGIIRKEQVPPTMTFANGQRIDVTIADIDTRRHRIYLAPVLVAKPIGYR